MPYLARPYHVPCHACQVIQYTMPYLSRPYHIHVPCLACQAISYTMPYLARPYHMPCHALRPFMLCTLLSEIVWLYLWSPVSIFMTPEDTVLLSIENTNLHMPSLQLGGNFEFNVIRKNPNISEWNCESNLCQMCRCYVSKSSLFDNIAK